MKRDLEPILIIVNIILLLIILVLVSEHNCDCVRVQDCEESAR